MEKFTALFFTYPAPENHYPVVLPLSTLYGRDSNCLGFAQSSSLQPNTTHSHPDQILIKKPKGNLLVQPFPAGDFGPRHDLVDATANQSQNTEKKKKAEKCSYSLLCYL